MLTRPTLSALRDALPPPHARLLRALEAAARETDCDLWAVGGVVRDLALASSRTRVHDLDLAVRGPLDALVEAAARRLRLPGEDVEHAPRFGTASLYLRGEDPNAPRALDARVDLAHLRSERYVVPGALPEVRATDSIEADLKRRDFSVNAMAMLLTGPERGDLVDPYGGLDDLRTRTLRVLHERSFVDDATRLWRGARVSALFDLAPDATTGRLIEDGARWLEPISGERLWAEVANTAHRGSAGRTLALLEAWGVLRGVHPHLALTEASARALRGRRAMPDVRLAAVLLAPLPSRDRAAILTRLNAGREARGTVEDAARLLDAARGEACEVTGYLAPRVLMTLEDVRPEARIAARWLDPECQPLLQQRLSRWERTTPPLTAETLVALGVPRGPAIGRTLAGLRRARYLGTLGAGAAVRRAAQDEVRRRVADGRALGEGWD